MMSGSGDRSVTESKTAGEGLNGVLIDCQQRALTIRKVQ